MTDRPVTAVPGTTQGPPARLEPNAIGAAQDTLIGMANSAPTVSTGLTLATLAAVSAYAVGPVIILTAVPMLIIANAYRRLNLWNANCGASFEWVGRAVNPYLGFLTGWLMIAGSLVGAISGVVVLAPSVLAIFNTAATSTWPNILISTAVILVMLTIAIVGIRITARTQVGMAAIEYTILIGFAIWGFVAVLGHHHGTFPITRGWFSISGIGGKGSLSAGFLIAVFMYTGWDATVYVNEEVKHRRHNPGRAAVMAVALLAIIFTVSEMGLVGVVSPAKLQANSSSALVYVAQALGGGGWAKVMALSLALSVIASTGTAIVIIARMVYGMASHRVLPPVLGNVNRRFSTPVVASVVIGLILIAATWVYLLSSSVANVFTSGDRRNRAAVRRVLHPHRVRRHHVLPAPCLQQCLGRAARRHPAARRRRVPGLDHLPVAANRARVADLVGGRHRRRRADADVRRTVRPAVTVLPDPAGECQ